MHRAAGYTGEQPCARSGSVHPSGFRQGSASSPAMCKARWPGPLQLKRSPFSSNYLMDFPPWNYSKFLICKWEVRAPCLLGRPCGGAPAALLLRAELGRQGEGGRWTWLSPLVAWTGFLVSSVLTGTWMGYNTHTVLKQGPHSVRGRAAVQARLAATPFSFSGRKPTNWNMY